jgi:hypothetical protein
MILFQSCLDIWLICYCFMWEVRLSYVELLNSNDNRSMVKAVEQLSDENAFDVGDQDQRTEVCTLSKEEGVQ